MDHLDTELCLLKGEMPRKAAGAKLEHIAGSDLPPDAAHDIYPGHIPRTDAQVVPIAPEAPEAWEETPQNGAVRGTKDLELPDS